MLTIKQAAVRHLDEPQLLPDLFPSLKITSEHLVQLPVVKSFKDLSNLFAFPDFSILSNPIR